VVIKASVIVPADNLVAWKIYSFSAVKHVKFIPSAVVELCELFKNHELEN
jgi:hypothetical protein